MIGGGVVLAIIAVLLVALGTRFLQTKGWSSPIPRPDGGYLSGGETDTEHAEKQSGLLRWLTTVDHKDIGILYLVFGTVAALWGGTEAMMIRTELLTPTADVWTAATYNGLFTTHGITMLFFFVTPVFFGIANYFLPLLLDADDMAFPRINAIAFWMLPPSLLLSRAGLPADALGKLLSTVGVKIPFLEALHPPETGWTLYAPLSIQSGNPQVDLLLLGLHLSGIATTLGAINFIITVVSERGDDIGWPDIDIFSWTMLSTSGIVLFAFPLLGSAVIMMLLDRNFGTTFYLVEGGGPILWQHLFWFFGHPEVYIIFLPATGLVSTILPKFSSRKLFGFKFIVYSTLAIGVLSFGVWAHHMFSTGIDPRVRASFMFVSLAIAVPSAVKVFNWISTMYDGRIRLTAPMIFAVGSIGTFILGGVTGVFLAAIPIDLVVHDTYFVVGHFHFIVMGIIPMMMFAASYYWYPIITGRMYDTLLARLQAVLTIIGVPITFGSMLIMGALGLPRRYANYPEQFAMLQQVASVGAFIIGIGVLLWLWNMVQSYRVGPRVRDADVWKLKRDDAFTREWQWFEQKLADRYGTDGGESDDD
ncbi:cytochrome c oxidase subunit I [Halococcus morrhuae DSM 1307]|uniref:Cytochrome c oxidase subunit I n=1 Tax=Halococcus morrhuae DSM 1307 TaxID=931277 RepID=M0M4M4_HALMO|nr:cbb3-type cytochrome c oxidase subunit I [Halococcus morrhuae]EMA40353.1 cytochrome c oxidase subunit I [Halococcus morrhuae DSM 1307]